MKVYFVTFALMCFFMVSVMADVIPYQSTYCASNTGSCSIPAESTVDYCECATVFSGEHICTRQMNCDYAAACLPDNTCDKPGSVCVLDPRCNNTPLCYSVGLFDPNSCPPRSK